MAQVSENLTYIAKTLILGFHSSTDFKYNTGYSNRMSEEMVKKYTPNGMLDMMQIHAAAWDATLLHDHYFIPNSERLGGNPNEFAKWVMELGLEPEMSNLDLVLPGKDLQHVYNSFRILR